MAKTIHTATLPDGSIAKRTSQSRTYSHCIATRSLYEVALRDADRDWAVDAKNFAYHAAGAAAQIGSPQHPGNAYLARHVHTAESIADHARLMDGCATAAEYVAKRRAARVAQVEADKVAGRFDRWHGSAWASRLDLAEKAANQFRSHCEVRIVQAKVGA